MNVISSSVVRPGTAPSREPAPVAPGRALRICHVAYTFYESDNRVMRYAQAVADRGDEVEVFALCRPMQPRTEMIRGVRVHRIQRRTVSERLPGTYLIKILWFLGRTALQLAGRHLRRPYDLVHVHNVPDFLVFAALVPRLLGARVILDIHDVLPELYAGKFASAENSVVSRLLLLVERLSCRFAHHVIVANDLWRERLIARAVDASNCTTFLNYPDLRMFAPRPAARRRDGQFLLLYPGSLNRHQGLDVAIRAFARVVDRMPDAEFHIYGEGPARPELELLARESGLTGRLRLFDPLPLDQICAIMASADLGVEPKQAEGFANEALSTKILEFMASGVPVVVSRTRIHDYYFDDSLVRFFAPGDDRELGEAILEAYQRRHAESGRLEAATSFARRYSWQERHREYLRLVERLITPVTAPERRATRIQP